jgi:hypothetical protein
LIVGAPGNDGSPVGKKAMSERWKMVIAGGGFVGFGGQDLTFNRWVDHRRRSHGLQIQNKIIDR